MIRNSTALPLGEIVIRKKDKVFGQKPKRSLPVQGKISSNCRTGHCGYCSMLSCSHDCHKRNPA